MTTITATLKVITPLFLGGAEPNAAAELRPPSIKGALRFWYRAIEPKYKEHEPEFFGDTDKGQAQFLIGMGKSITGNETWNSGNCYRDFHGIRYLSFSLDLGDNKRKYIEPGEEINLRFNLKPKTSEDCEKALVSSLWLLGHVGGLGSRSRRGLGTVALMSYSDSKFTEELPPAHGSKTLDEWETIFKSGLNKLNEWYEPKGRENDHSVLNDKAKFYLYEKGYSGKNYHNRQCKGWEVALDEAGLVMQNFRHKRDVRDNTSDYHRVKDHISRKSYLKEGPERAAFGLPLTFRYSSLGGKNTEFHGVDRDGVEHERNASPIHIRVIKIGSAYHPMYIRLDAPQLKIKDKRGTYPNKGDSILDVFCSKKVKPAGYREVQP